MDVKDRKILGELARDARQPVTTIAKAVGVSREVADYRIKRLSELVITAFTIAVDPAILGYSRTGLFISLQGANRNKEEEYIRAFTEHPYISGISTTIGKYDIVLDIYYRDDNHLKEVITECETLLGEHLKEYIIANFPVETRIFYEKVLGLPKHKQNLEAAEISELDTQILKELNADARTTVADISDQVGATPKTVRAHIRKLRKQNIFSPTIQIDYAEMGKEMYNLQISIDSLKEHEKVATYLAVHPTVWYYYHYFGNALWDMDIGILIENKQQLREFIADIKEHFGHLIEFTEIYPIETIYKEILPEGIFS